MNLYAHAVLANHLLPLVKPADPAEYLWGTVIPDIRYLTGMRRNVTHLPDEEIMGWFVRYPDRESFIQGYRVHCLLDRINTVQVIGGKFPLNLVSRIRRKPFSSQQMAVIVELYYQKTAPQGVTLNGSHNAILDELGVSAEQSEVYASALGDYLAAPSFETAMIVFPRLGVIEDSRVEKYVSAYRGIQNNRLLLWMMTSSAKNAGLKKLADSKYRALPQPAIPPQ